MALEELLRRLFAEGITFRIEGEDLVFDSPPPEGLAGALPAHADALACLAELCPYLGRQVLARGRRARVWGVTLHGVIVEYRPDGPLYTTEPAEVELEEDDPAPSSAPPGENGR